MNRTTRISSALASLVVLGFAVNSHACSTDAWDGVSGGIADSPSTVSRYSELCAFEVDAAGYVQSNRASDQRYIARFYVLNGLGGTGDVPVFQAFSDDAATTGLFTVSLDGTQFTIDVVGGGLATASATSGWNLVEVDWESDGTLSFWINADSQSEAATDSISAGTGAVEAIRLGAPTGLGTQTGKLTFDSFESHRSTPVGGLIACDADGSGDPDININDILAVINERFGSPPVLATGQPDCNLDGEINLNDILTTIEAAFPSS